MYTEEAATPIDVNRGSVTQSCAKLPGVAPASGAEFTSSFQ